MNLDSLFDSTAFNSGLDLEQLLVADGGKRTTNIYRPSLKGSGVTNYTSVLKFLPYYKDPSRLWIKKYEVFLKNADTDEQRSIACPTTIAKDEPSVLQDAFFGLYNSDYAPDKHLSKEFKRRDVYYALIQVVKDKQQPELEGKIMIYQFGKKIYDKIHEIMKPSNPEIEEHNPFDIINGYLFYLTIVQDGQFPNYDKSQFSAKVLPGLMIDGKEVLFKNKPQEVKDYLVENTPDIDVHQYKPWDAATNKFVADVINSHLSSHQLLDKLKRKFPEVFEGSGGGNTTGRSSSTTTASKPRTTVAKTITEELEEDDELETFLTSEKKTTKTSEPAKTKTKAKPAPAPIVDEDDEDGLDESDEDDDDIIDDDFFKL